MNRLNFLILVGLSLVLSLGSTAIADIMKCSMGNGQWNYFQSDNPAERKKCKAPASVVVTSMGEKIKESYSMPKPTKQTLVAAKDIQPVCGGSGGTVKFNGRVFHLDYSDICERYSDKEDGGIRYAKRPVNLHRIDTAYQKEIAGYVQKIAHKYNLEAAFIHAIISAESAYNPQARSHVGAQGLMQLMPFTAKRFGVRNSYDPLQNIEAGAKYLNLLFEEFGSLELAAAGYNAGEGAVRKYKKTIPPFKETRAYVPKVMAFYYKYKADQKLISAN